MRDTLRRVGAAELDRAPLERLGLAATRDEAERDGERRYEKSRPKMTKSKIAITATGATKRMKKSHTG